MHNAEGMPSGDSKLLFRRFKVGETIEIEGVKLKVEWAQNGRVLFSLPQVGGPKFKRDGRTSRLTFAEAIARMPASADT